MAAGRWGDGWMVPRKARPFFPHPLPPPIRLRPLSPSPSSPNHLHGNGKGTQSCISTCRSLASICIHNQLFLRCNLFCDSFGVSCCWSRIWVHPLAASFVLWTLIPRAYEFFVSFIVHICWLVILCIFIIVTLMMIRGIAMMVTPMYVHRTTCIHY